MLQNLLDPLFLFFAVGFVAGVAKSDVKLPESVYHLLSTYLLLAIGLKGGVQLSEARFADIWLPALTTIAVGALTPFLVFLVSRKLGRLNNADAASLAAHYGSVSAVTFAAALEYARRHLGDPEGFLPVLLVVYSLWFGYDGFLHSDPEYEHRTFNRVMFGVIAAICLWVVPRGIREFRATRAQAARSQDEGKSS